MNPTPSVTPSRAPGATSPPNEGASPPPTVDRLLTVLRPWGAPGPTTWVASVHLMHWARQAWHEQGVSGLDAWVASLRTLGVVHLPDAQGRVALEGAIEGADPAWRTLLVSRLLAAGGDPNRKVPAHDLTPGATPLLLAVRTGDPDLVDRLLDAGACVTPKLEVQPYSPWACDTTPLHEAVVRNDLPMLERLLAGLRPVRVDAQDLRQNTPLMLTFAAKTLTGPPPLPRLEAMERLIAAGANVNARRANRQRLQFATLHARDPTPVLRRLLAAGIDPNAREQGTRDTLLAQFCNMGTPNLDAVNVLLAGGANARTVNVYGNTPLHFATSQLRWSWPLLTALVNAGASLNVKNQDGQTPLGFLHDELEKLKKARDPSYDDQLARLAHLKECSTLARTILADARRRARAGDALAEADQPGTGPVARPRRRL